MATRGTPPTTPPLPPTEEVPFGQPSDEELAYVLTIAKTAARRFGAAPHEVDEVAQRTAVKLWHRWEHPTVHAVRSKLGLSWDAYIRRTARNVHLDLIRSHHRRLERNTKASPIRVSNTHPRPGTVTQAPQTTDGVTAYIARQTIVDRIDALPAKQRLVARLVILNELTPREAAEVLGMQPQSVRKHLRAAKEALINHFNNRHEG